MIKIINSELQEVTVGSSTPLQSIKLSNLNEQIISVRENVNFCNIKIDNEEYTQLIVVRDFCSSSGDSQIYEGSYEVTPKVTPQVLQTEKKLMQKNVEVKAIPYYRTPNNKGGNTISIG